MNTHRFLTVSLAALMFAGAQWAAGQTAMGPLRPQGVSISDADAPPPVKVMIGRKDVPQFHIAPPAGLARQSKGAAFTIRYLNTGETNYYDDVCVGWPEEAKTAFTYAANIWGALINSSVPIVISACWANMGTDGVLGHGGARSYYRDFSGAPQSSTFYPVAIANALYGSDLNGGVEEIVIAYNAQFTDWYFGTGICPSDKIDFIQVIMHEMCHGLGFIGSMSASGGRGYWGILGYPAIYDRYTENGAGIKLIAYSSGSVALYNQLISDNVYFNGVNANAGNAGNKVKLYAPTTWSSGSSYAHLGEIFNGTPNAMMTYSVNYGETIHNPGPVTLGILKDSGWTQAVFTNAVFNDYDGDGKSDLAVYRNGYWSIFSLANGIILSDAGVWGGSDYIPVPGDFNGDGKADLAVYRSGVWSLYSLANGLIANHANVLSGSGYLQAPGDYDGDGKSDLAACRNGYWSIYLMAGSMLLDNVGGWGSSDCIPVPGDYDGDGKADLAFYRNGFWSIYSLANGIILLEAGPWGGPDSIPVPGDYDGDGESDLAVYRNGYWSIFSLANGIILLEAGPWGESDSIPVPGDYDGDGKYDLAVYRSGYWSIFSLVNGIILTEAGPWGGPDWTPIK